MRSERREGMKHMEAMVKPLFAGWEVFSLEDGILGICERCALKEVECEKIRGGGRGLCWVPEGLIYVWETEEIGV